MLFFWSDKTNNSRQFGDAPTSSASNIPGGWACLRCGGHLLVCTCVCALRCVFEAAVCWLCCSASRVVYSMLTDEQQHGCVWGVFLSLLRPLWLQGMASLAPLLLSHQKAVAVNSDPPTASTHTHTRKQTSTGRRLHFCSQHACLSPIQPPASPCSPTTSPTLCVGKGIWVCVCQAGRLLRGERALCHSRRAALSNCHFLTGR